MMQYILTPNNSGQEHIAWWDGAFNDEQLNWLQHYARNSKVRGSIGGAPEGREISDVRRSNVMWMPCNEHTFWVFEILGNVVSKINSMFFRFDLTGFGEHIQLTNYDSSELGMYGWHIDKGNNFEAPSRKLSVVVQLSNPEDYEGGDLEVQPYGSEIFKVEKKRGYITFFPSWTLHQVTPVIRGNRQSLVAWISGPPFK